MPPRTPFRDGFSALWHEPVLLPAELMWRWCFGLSAWALAILSLALFLDSIRVPAADGFLLRTFQPLLLQVALRDMFRGTLPRFVLQQTLLILGVIVLWALAATAGRAATLRRLVAMFARDEEAPLMDWKFASIFLLQLFRAAWSLLACAVAACLFLYGVVMLRQQPLRAVFALFVGFGMACLVGAVLNWFFGVAPLFCIRNGSGAPGALDQAIDFSGRHAGRLFLLAIVFFFLRAMWAGTMFLTFLAPLNWASQIGAGWIALPMALVALVYFAGADLLYLARLGAYVSLSDDEGHTITSESRPEILPLEELA